MIRINPHYPKLQSSYLFSTISRKVDEYRNSSPDADVISLGIGDVTRALTPSVIAAFHAGVDELAADATFKGYGPYQGYGFLRELVCEVDFRSRGCGIEPGDIFMSDGAKSDTANFQELFAPDIRVAVPDPVYPVYVDTNVMAGRTGAFTGGRYEGLLYLESTKENGFVPPPPNEAADLVYLCFPNNPTGAVATKRQLEAWVAYAHEHRALILFDAAYVEFIRDPEIPRSIYEIAGADEVAVEFHSFSKTAGFTGTRAAYTVVPEACAVTSETGSRVPLRDLWLRRISTKYNGLSYPIQRAAAAVYSPQGQKEIRELSDYYLENAKIIRRAMTGLGFACTGGDNSPYVWVETGRDSWEFFDYLLSHAAVVTTPGSGFGTCGGGYVRISAFNHRERVEEAVERIRRLAW